MFEDSKCINRSSDNTMTMRKRPTIIYKTLHRRLKLEHYKPLNGSEHRCSRKLDE